MCGALGVCSGVISGTPLVHLKDIISALGEYHQCNGGEGVSSALRLYHDLCGGYHQCIGRISSVQWGISWFMGGILSVHSVY